MTTIKDIQKAIDDRRSAATEPDPSEEAGVKILHQIIERAVDELVDGDNAKRQQITRRQVTAPPYQKSWGPPGDPRYITIGSMCNDDGHKYRTAECTIELLVRGIAVDLHVVLQFLNQPENVGNADHWILRVNGVLQTIASRDLDTIALHKAASEITAALMSRATSLALDH